MNNDDKNNPASNHNPALSGYFPNLRVVSKIYKYGKKQLPENDKRAALRAHIMAGGTPKEFSSVRSWHATTAGKMLQQMGIKKVFITEEEHAIIKQLRKERLKSDGAASAFVNMSCRASRAETDRNNLRADLDAIKAILTEEKARAERAELEVEAYKKTLAELTKLNTKYIADQLNWDWQRQRDEARCELITRTGEIQTLAEALAIERARMDWLLNITQPPVVHTTGWPYPDTRGTYGHRFIGRVYYESCEGRPEMTYFKDRTAIDAAMKEGEK